MAKRLVCVWGGGGGWEGGGETVSERNVLVFYGCKYAVAAVVMISNMESNTSPCADNVHPAQSNEYNL